MVFLTQNYQKKKEEKNLPCLYELFIKPRSNKKCYLRTIKLGIKVSSLYKNKKLN